MDQSTVVALIDDVLANYQYTPPAPGTTIGVPWSADKVYRSVVRLKESLVEPYLQRFELRETYEQCTAAESIYANYWVIAESLDYLEWFDPETGEFGLAVRGEPSKPPISIGVRGDLVGVFCAM